MKIIPVGDYTKKDVIDRIYGNYIHNYDHLNNINSIEELSNWIKEVDMDTADTLETYLYELYEKELTTFSYVDDIRYIEFIAIIEDKGDYHALYSSDTHSWQDEGPMGEPELFAMSIDKIDIAKSMKSYEEKLTKANNTIDEILRITETLCGGQL